MPSLLFNNAKHAGTFFSVFLYIEINAGCANLMLLQIRGSVRPKFTASYATFKPRISKPYLILYSKVTTVSLESNQIRQLHLVL